MPADDGTQTLEEFRNSEEGKQPASAEFERSLNSDNFSEQQGGRETPPDGASAEEQPGQPDDGSHEESTSIKGETEKGEQEDTKISARSKPEDRKRQVQGLSVEEQKLDADILATKQRIIEKRAARQAMLATAKDEGLFQRDSQRAAAVAGEGEEDLDDEPLTRKQVTEIIYTRDANMQLQTFLQTHPEYTPEKDPYNEKWDALQVALKKYKEPKDPADMRQVLEWAHADVDKRTSAPPSASKASQDAAAKARLATAGQGAGGGAKGGAKAPAAVDESKVQILINGGWTREEAIRNVQRASQR